MTMRDKRPQRPLKPKTPQLFEYERIVLKEQHPSIYHGSNPGTFYGPTTLAAVLDLLPDDADPSEVFIDAIDHEDGSAVFVLRKLILKPNAEKLLESFARDMEKYLEDMKVHSKEKAAWIKEYPERKRKSNVEIARKKLEELNKQQAEAEKKLREAEGQAHKEVG